MKEYIISLEKEMILYSEEMSDYKVKTIFIGGGTPSILQGKEMRKIIACLSRHYHLEKDIEISIEANPGLLDKEKLNSYYSSGINRLSIGLQACQNHLLQNLGRIHRYEDFIWNLEDARRVGFTNINVDLMFGLPNQKIEEWYASLKTLVELEIPHLSTYSLIIEEDTPFHQWVEEKRIEKIDEEMELAMYHDAINYLKDKGYTHYEISNFAKPSYKCQHNMIYWRNQEYLGFGVAAHSHLHKKRFNNHQKIEIYCSSLQKNQKPIEDVISLSLKDEISETMFLGLRMMTGISVKDFEKRFKKTPYEIYGEKLEELRKNQLIEYNDNFVKLTTKGIDLANRVFQEMLLD